MTARWLPVVALALPLAFASSCAATADDDVIAVTGESTAADEARSDNVEIKVTVRSDQIARTMSRLRLTLGSATQRDVYFYEYRGTTIWGATARILKTYLDVVTEAA